MNEGEKETETRQGWKNARRLPYICCVLFLISGSLFLFISALFLSFFGTILNLNKVLQKLFLVVVFK